MTHEHMCKDTLILHACVRVCVCVILFVCGGGGSFAYALGHSDTYMGWL